MASPSPRTPKPPRGRAATAAEEALARALAHPLRWQVLALLNEGTNTPAGIARELGVRTENVSYHVRVLSDLGLIELVRTAPVRGALEHHYRARADALPTDAEASAQPLHVRRDVNQDVVRNVVGGLIRTLADDAPHERADTHVSRTPVEVDEQGWSEINERLGELLDRVLEIESESRSRAAPDGADDGRLRTEVVLLHYPCAAPAR